MIFGTFEISWCWGRCNFINWANFELAQKAEAEVILRSVKRMARFSVH